MSFKSILKDILKPFARAGEQASIVGATFGSAKDPEKYKALRNYKPRFLNESETVNQLENPALTSLKTGVGIGSFLTPGASLGAGASTGARILQGAKLAGIGSAAGAFGSSESEGLDLIGDVAKAGVVGAVTGGTLTAGGIGLSKILGKTPTTSTGFRAKNLGIKTPKTPTGDIDKLALETNVLNIMDEFNLPVNSKRQAVKSMSTAYKNLAGELQNSVIAKGDVRLPKNGIFDDAFNRASTEIDDVTAGAAGKTMEVYKNKLMKDGMYFSPQEALKFKFDLQKEMGPIYKRIKMGDSLSAKESIIKSFHDSVDDVLKEAVPEAGDALSKMSTLHSAAPDIVTSASKGTKLGIRPLGLDFGSIDTTGATDLIRSLGAGIGTGAKRAGASIGSALSKVPLERVSAGAGLLEGLALTGQPEKTSEDVLGAESGGAGQGGAPTVDIERERALITLDLMSKGAKPTEAKSYADLITLVKYGSKGSGGEFDPTSDTGRKMLAARIKAKEALDTLQTQDDVTGKTQGIENLFESLTGQATPASEYKTQLEAMRTMVMSALGGATLPPGEIKRFETFLPKITDSKSQAEQKLQTLIPMIEALI